MTDDTDSDGDDMTSTNWAFEIGDTFRFQVGDDMEGVEFAIVSRDRAHGMRTYLLVSHDPEHHGATRVEFEQTLAAMREMEAILGERQL